LIDASVGCKSTPSPCWLEYYKRPDGYVTVPGASLSVAADGYTIEGLGHAAI